MVDRDTHKIACSGRRSNRRSTRVSQDAPLMPIVRRLLLLCCLLLSVVPLTSCSWLLPPPVLRGNKVDSEHLKELVPGTSTKADVTALIGSPTQKAMFDDNTWLYITEVTRPRVGQTLGLLDQDVVVLSFDDRGVLTGTKTVTKDD